MAKIPVAIGRSLLHAYERDTGEYVAFWEERLPDGRVSVILEIDGDAQREEVFRDIGRATAWTKRWQADDRPR